MALAGCGSLTGSQVPWGQQVLEKMAAGVMVFIFGESVVEVLGTQVMPLGLQEYPLR